MIKAIIKLLFYGIVGLLCLDFSLNNNEVVAVHFILDTYIVNFPLFVPLFGMFLLGFTFGYLYYTLKRR